MIKDTSLEAFDVIQKDNTAETMRMIILHYLQKHPEGMTRQELSKYLNISINSTCGRCCELIKLGVVYEDGKRRNANTGKMNYILKAK